MTACDDRSHASVVITTRVAFAGLSKMCVEILLEGLAQRPDIELISPWTQLPLLGGDGTLGLAEILFVELETSELPPALRVLMVAAEPLKIVGISKYGSKATLFSLQEQRSILIDADAPRVLHRVSESD